MDKYPPLHPDLVALFKLLGPAKPNAKYFQWFEWATGQKSFFDVPDCRKSTLRANIQGEWPW